MEIVHLTSGCGGKFLFIGQAALVDVLLQQRVDVLLLLALQYLVLVIEHQLVDQQLGEAVGLLVSVLVFHRDTRQVGTGGLTRRRSGRSGDGDGSLGLGRRRRYWLWRRGGEA